MVIPSLIQTKLGIPPTRPTLVRRRRLIERLTAGLPGKLTLISAPAGYGKTTLAAEWLRGVQRAVAWLSLDEADNDPARFLTYFLAALHEIDEKAGRETGSLLQSPEPPSPASLAVVLLNELAAIPLPFVLVIDDYQVIQSLAIHQLLNALVEHQPGQMHLVLITREDPPFALPRLRARNQLTEIRQADLRFSEAECAEFLENGLSLKIARSDIAALERRTEGWIAGLQLATIAMQSALSTPERSDLQRFVEEFTGSNRYVLDYLAQEVFERQPAGVQDFLLKTSILDRLCAALCDAVTGGSGSQDWIDSLENANLFILPLDQSRTWYRYHRLFRDLLSNRLRLRGEPVLNELHTRAASWYESHGLLPEAVQHALAGSDWQRALKLFHAACGPMIQRGEVFTLLNGYRQIPEPLVRGDPETCLEYGWVLLLSGQFEHAALYLSLAEGYAIPDPGFAGQLLNARAFLARAQGDLPRMLALSQQALAILPSEDRESRCVVSINLAIAFWHGGKMDAAERALAEVLETGRATDNRYAISMAAVFQGMILAVRGKLREAHDRFLAIVRQEDASAFLRQSAYLYLSILEYEWNHLEQSGKYLLDAARINERIQNDELSISNGMMTARLHLAGGNLAAAGEALQKAEQKAAEGEFSVPALPRLAAVRVQLALAAHDLAAASAWAERMSEGSDWHPFSNFTNTTRALYLLAMNQPVQAAGYLEGCFAQASQEGWGYSRIIIRALQVLAAAQLGPAGRSAAFEYLQDALQWAQPDGFVRTFLDLGPGMESLLQEALRRRVASDAAQRILSAAGAVPRESVLGQLALVEPINPRELEVLRLVAAGYTNRQIAGELVISTGTVKTHVHNISGKLGAHNRTEIASRARELGLV